MTKEILWSLAATMNPLLVACLLLAFAMKLDSIGFWS
jgi:hypothetical protein